ncbi:MAG: F0F1 ATP synthase subunit B [Baekduia sp.]
MTEALLNALPLAAAAEGGEESGGSFLVSPEWGLMLWTLLVFGVSLLILWKLAFPKISEVLDKRQRLIEDSIEHANKTRAEADTLLEEYRERLKEARTQADEIVAHAKKAGAETERDALEDARRTREDLLEQTRKDIDAETQKALQDIRKEVANLTIAATEHVTRKSLNEDDQKRLVDEALADLDFQVFGSR